MRYLGPLAVFAVSVAVAYEPSIGVMPVLAFLFGLLSAILPPALPERYGRTIGYSTIFLVPVFFPRVLPYLPAAVYWLEHEGEKRLLLFLALPGLIAGLGRDLHTAALTASLSLLAGLFGYVARQQSDTEADVLSRMDRERSQRIRAETERRAKIAEAERDVRLATLAERNRIARDLHDTIGHVLSSALLQTTALLAEQDENSRTDAIRDIQATLNLGMDRARQSVHGLYEESLSFEYELKEVMDRFTFCTVSSQVDFRQEPPHDYRQTMLKAVREALANVVRHSNATAVQIMAVEHPGFYQLRVKDNGTRILTEAEEASRSGVHLGLGTMSERAGRHNGTLRIERKGGFGIILTLPKRTDDKQSEKGDA